MTEEINKKKYITLDYEEYLSLIKYKNAFENINCKYQFGKTINDRNAMTWQIENMSELYNLISKLSLHPQTNNYDSILIYK